MDDDAPLYNSRIPKMYLEYIQKFHPDVDIHALMNEAEITEFEINDPGHWFTQKQINRFHEKMDMITGNLNISREMGRYCASSKGIGAAKQMAIGLINVATAYQSFNRIYAAFSRHATFKTKKTGPNSIEMTTIVKPGVKEEPFQCQNRTGAFESMAQYFTKKYAHVEHPKCLHKGDDCCHYIISWKKTPSTDWKLVRNYLILISILVLPLLIFFLPILSWCVVLLLKLLGIASTSYYAAYLDIKELSAAISSQGDTARELLDEINIRHDNSRLIQEVGKATAMVVSVDDLVETVVHMMKKHLGFDRGMILLKQNNMLLYKNGYGFSDEEKRLLRGSDLHLDRFKSNDALHHAYTNQLPFLINNIDEMEKKFPKKPRLLPKG